MKKFHAKGETKDCGCATLINNVDICSYFTIAGSKLIKYKGKYHVSITSHDFTEPQVLEVAIRNSKKEGGDHFEVAKNVSLSNGQTQKVEFDVSTISTGS